MQKYIALYLKVTVVPAVVVLGIAELKALVIKMVILLLRVTMVEKIQLHQTLTVQAEAALVP